jgi:hypothetical protein
MKQILFEVPIWKKQIDPLKIELISSGFEPSFISGLKTSFNGKNSMSEKGEEYLKNCLQELLNEINVKKINLISIWRNIYENNFQDKHNHAGCNFSFIIYEKINQPQTIFYHPSSDLIYASKTENIFPPQKQLDVIENDLVVFPSYVDHMVCLTENALTMSGNFDIET